MSVINLIRTCQRCNKQFNPQSNNNNSCIFHCCMYVERESFTKAWDCCGKTGDWSRECGIGRHITYDESWKKDDDFYAKRRPEIFFDIQTVRTCQRCNNQFNANNNTDSSCKYHRCDFNGKIWDCCAGVSGNAIPCASSKHITYDKKWIKFDDFFIKPIKPITKMTIGQNGSWIYHPQKGYIMVTFDANDEHKYKYKHNNDNNNTGSDVIDIDYIINMCQKYNNKKISQAINELMKKLPFTKVTSHLIAQMIIIDLMKTKKLYGVNLIYDLDEITNTNADQITENLISTFSSHTLDKLAEIL